MRLIQSHFLLNYCGKAGGIILFTRVLTERKKASKDCCSVKVRFSFCSNADFLLELYFLKTLLLNIEFEKFAIIFFTNL